MGGSLASPSVEKLKGEKNEILRTILSLWRVLQLHKKSAKSCSKLLDQVPGTIFTMSLHSVLAKLFKTAKSDTAFQGATTLLNFIITQFLSCLPPPSLLCQDEGDIF